MENQEGQVGQENQEGQVGYRNPPRHARFQKGRSGNPGGRPKNPDLLPDFETEVRNTRQEEVKIREGGKTIKVSKQVAVIKKIFMGACKAKVKPLARIRKALAKRKSATVGARATAQEAVRAESAVRFIARWQRILDTQTELKIETRRVLRSHGAPDSVIDDIFGVPGFPDDEAERRRERARDALRALDVPAELIAVAGGVHEAYDYFCRDRAGWQPEDPERAAAYEAAKAGGVH